jgi:predicted GNAT family acetyltransferase
MLAKIFNYLVPFSLKKWRKIYKKDIFIYALYITPGSGSIKSLNPETIYSSQTVKYLRGQGIGKRLTEAVLENAKQ